MSENYSMNELNPQHDSFLFDIIEILQWSGQLFIVLLKNICVFLIPRGCSTLFEQMSLFSKFTQAYDNFIQSLIEKGPGTLYKEEDKNMNQVNNKDNRNIFGNNARKEESWQLFISMSLLLRWANEKNHSINTTEKQAEQQFVKSQCLLTWSSKTWWTFFFFKLSA